jgi:hypothetical protein
MLDAGGVYQNWYTSTDRAMAEGIATSLKRVGNPGRLVQLPGGEILDTWEKGT